MADELRIASHLTGVVEFATTAALDGAVYTSKVQDSIIGAQGGSYTPTYSPAAAIKYAGGKVTTNVVEGAVVPQVVASALTGATPSGTAPGTAIVYYVKVESHTGSPGAVNVYVGSQLHASLELNQAVSIPFVAGAIADLKLDCANYTAATDDVDEISATVTVIIA